MYKRLGTIATIGLLMSGCGVDTSPNGSILNEINERKISNQEQAAGIIKDYYKRARTSIINDNCGKLEISSENAIDLSIIELSNKYCDNPIGLKNEIEKVLSKVNMEKSMSIQMNSVDNTEEYIQAKFSTDEIEVLKKNNIGPEEAISIYNYMKTSGFASKRRITTKMCNYIYTKEDFKSWLNIRSRNITTIEDILEVLELGVKTPDEALKWGMKPKGIQQTKEMGIKTVEEYNLWVKTDFPSNIEEYIKRGITASQVLDYRKAGMTYLDINQEDFIELIDKGFTLAKYKLWNNLDIELDIRKIYYLDMKKISPNDMIDYKLTKIPYKTIQGYFNKKIDKENMYKKYTNK